MLHRFSQLHDVTVHLGQVFINTKWVMFDILFG
jgi:hypothetical protein